MTFQLFLSLLQRCLNAKRGCSTAIEKQLVVAVLAEQSTFFDLAKELIKDKRTSFIFVEKPDATPRKDKGPGRYIPTCFFFFPHVFI